MKKFRLYMRKFIYYKYNQNPRLYILHTQNVISFGVALNTFSLHSTKIVELLLDVKNLPNISRTDKPILMKLNNHSLQKIN